MNMLTTQTKSTSPILLAAWIVASALGIIVGFLVTLPLLWSMSENVTRVVPEFVGQLLGGAFFGFGVGLATGFAQWLVLRMRGEANPRWLIASIVGGIVGGIVAILFSAAFNDGGENMLMTIITFALLGAILGGAQFLMARVVMNNALWIVASAVGLALGAAIPFGDYNLEIVGVLIGGLVYGVITAAALWWFSKQ